MVKNRGKAGTSKEAASIKKIAYAHEYIANGQNKYQAAVAAGYKPGKGASKAAERLSADVGVQRMIAEATAKAAAKSGLTVERTLQEVARLAYADPRKMYDSDGNLIPVHLLDASTAATIAAVEVTEIGGGVIGHTKKVRVWDKNAALEKAMKYHGLYEADNAQKPPSVVVVSDTDAKL